MAGSLRTLEVVKIIDGFGVMRNPSYVEAVVLVANASQQVTVPTGATMCIFSSTVDFYAAYGSNPTAVVPGASTTDGSSNELNPLGRHIGLGEVAKIALISPSNGVVTISFWNS